MKQKKWIFLMIVLISSQFGACSRNDDPTVSPQAETRLFTPGQLVTSEFMQDNVVIESMIDTVVNFGSDAAPALFFIAGEHKLNGIEMTEGNLSSNVFRSITRDELHGFIVKWAKVMGATVDLNDNSDVSVQQRQMAFRSLQDFLIQNDVDLPLLVALSRDAANLQSAKDLIEAARTSAVSLKVKNSPNSADNILNAIEISGITPTDLTMAITKSGISVNDFVNLVNSRGINFAQTLKDGIRSKGEVTEVIDAVLEGLVKVSKIIVWFIENAAPVINIEDQYVSYLNQNDTLPMHYLSAKDPVTSPVYSVAYCSLAKASFYMETYYNGTHQTIPGQYITRSGMIVKSVYASGGMHVKGNTQFEIPHNAGTNDIPISATSGTVTVEYGDCCCFARKAKLTFDLSGDKGYVQTSWDSKVK